VTTILEGPALALQAHSLPEMLDRAGDGVAVIEHGEELSYGALRARSDACAAMLAARGIAPGARVALLIGNCAAFLVAQYGVFRAGAICVPINTRLSAAEVERVLRHSGAEALILQAEIAGKSTLGIIDPASLPDLKHVIASEDLPASNDAGISAPDCDAPALLIYTSGTTGEPKGCLHSHRALVNSAAQTARLKNLTAHDRIIASVPLFNIFGTLNCILEAFTVGATIVIQEVFDAGSTLDLIERHRVTVFLGTPTMWARLTDHPAYNDARVASLRAGIIAGQRVPPGVIDAWRARGVTLLEIYGLSEAPSVLADGRPVAGVDISLDEAGKLRTRGFNQMLGYFDDPAGTQARISDGWLDTGDLAERGGDGLIRIVGRADDMIIVGGFNVQPAEVEDVLRGHAMVGDVAVFGVPDADFGEVVAAWVVPAEGAQGAAEPLAAYCKSRLATYKVPKHIRFNDHLPLTANGKVLRRQMRAETARELSHD
jgi:acyl-CoA synthetase (AMP-forming)/AMP-acid ligase II